MVALLDSNEFYLHNCDFRHSLNFISVFLDTQRNEFPIKLGIFKINCFLPKLLESYGIPMSISYPFHIFNYKDL